jgi:hypothetical protein
MAGDFEKKYSIRYKFREKGNTVKYVIRRRTPGSPREVLRDYFEAVDRPEITVSDQRDNFFPISNPIFPNMIKGTYKSNTTFKIVAGYILPFLFPRVVAVIKSDKTTANEAKELETILGTLKNI